ncbi:MAG TPA: AMP-binding protein [Novosphingobium sp.]|nr:AMP-binding protein [Novosphingobium sp.]
MVLSNLISYAGDYHGATEVIGRRCDGSVERSNWAEMHRRSKRLASALRSLDLPDDCRVASLAWNTLSHLEVYYGVLGLGLPLHTLNPRLTAADLHYMIDLVNDTVCFVDRANLAMAAELAPLVPRIRTWIFLDEGRGAPDAGIDNMIVHGDLVRKGDASSFAWPEFDENRAATICFTSGTTGHPKGVVYSHRSITLSSMNMAMADMYGTQRRGEGVTALPMAAMFHANAWMMPFTAPMNGHRLVLPGRAMDAASLVDLLEQEQVTIAGAVPTVWQDIVIEMDRRGIDRLALHTALVAGTTLPEHLFDALKDRGIEPCQTWGMTEVPGAARATPPPGAITLPDGDRRQLALNRQGRVGLHALMRIVDDDGRALPHDGKSAGHLQVRGPTVVARYLGEEESEARDWLDTGDIAVIHPDSTMQIVDRAKDVIKSGGEWISSPQLESAAMQHPAVAAAAAIGVAHPRWQERPLLFCVLCPGHDAGVVDAIRAEMGRHVAKWWLPDEIRFIDSLPLTATGKVNKLALRTLHAQESER